MSLHAKVAEREMFRLSQSPRYASHADQDKYQTATKRPAYPAHLGRSSRIQRLKRAKTVLPAKSRSCSKTYALLAFPQRFVTSARPLASTQRSTNATPDSLARTASAAPDARKVVLVSPWKDTARVAQTVDWGAMQLRKNQRRAQNASQTQSLASSTTRQGAHSARRVRYATK